MHSSFTDLAFPALVLLLSFIVSASSSSVERRDAEMVARSVLPLKVDTIAQLPVGTNLDSIAVRQNEQLLVTSGNTRALKQVDPTGKLPPITVHTFSSAYEGIGGITETLPDVFYCLLTPPYSGKTYQKINGTASIFLVDMRTFAINAAGEVTSQATVTKLVDIPSAGFLNALTTLNTAFILATDSLLGKLWRINVYTGAYEVIIDDPKMKFPLTSPAPVGMNGVKVLGSYIYWANTGFGTFNRIPVGLYDTQPLGPSETIASVDLPDDFMFRYDGTAWVCSNPLGTLSVVQDGRVTVVVGSVNSTVLAGASAAQFGRSATTRSTLYVASNGGLANPNGLVGPATVSRIETGAYDIVQLGQACSGL